MSQKTSGNIFLPSLEAMSAFLMLQQTPAYEYQMVSSIGALTLGILELRTLILSIVFIITTHFMRPISAYSVCIPEQ